MVEKMETGQRVLSRTNRNRSWFGKFFGSCGPVDFPPDLTEKWLKLLYSQKIK